MRWVAPGTACSRWSSDQQAGGTEPERAWMVPSCPATGATVTYALAQTPFAPTGIPRRAGRTRAGRRRRPRGPAGVVPADRDAVRAPVVAAPVHHPSHVPGDRRPAAGRAVAELRQPEVRAALLAEEPAPNPDRPGLMSRWDQMFPLGDPPDYEPPPLASAAGCRRTEGRRRRRSSSTGCSSATARRCSSRRWRATSTATTRPSGR